jgi:hypothetical protein
MARYVSSARYNSVTQIEFPSIYSRNNCDMIYSVNDSFHESGPELALSRNTFSSLVLNYDSKFCACIEVEPPTNNKGVFYIYSYFVLYKNRLNAQLRKCFIVSSMQHVMIMFTYQETGGSCTLSNFVFCTHS